MPVRRRLAIATLLLVPVLAAGCDSVTLPASDGSAPQVELKASTSGYSTTVSPQVGPVSHTFTKSDVLSLVGQGTDAESGIKKISVNGDYTVSCDEPLGTENTSTIVHGVINEVTSAPDTPPGEKVLTSRAASYEVRFGDIAKSECPLPLKVFKHMKGTVTATAVNYFNGQTITKTFTFEAWS